MLHLLLRVFLFWWALKDNRKQYHHVFMLLIGVPKTKKDTHVPTKTSRTRRPAWDLFFLRPELMKAPLAQLEQVLVAEAKKVGSRRWTAGRKGGGGVGLARGWLLWKLT